MRSMVMEFPDDPNCRYLSTQYMLGDSLLVAPIFNDRSKARYYLPEGTWTSLLTGERREGGRWYKEHHGYLSIPLFVKESSIIAMGASDEGPEYDYAQDVTLRLYALKDGSAAETAVCDGKGREVLYARAARRGDSIHVEVDAEKPCCFEICREAGESIVKKLASGGSFDVKL